VGKPENNGWDAPVVTGTRTARVDEICDHQAPWGIHPQGGFIDPFGHLRLVGDKSPVSPVEHRAQITLHFRLDRDFHGIGVLER
jgi:hypothetical protein